jgi:hypothetical protein
VGADIRGGREKRDLLDGDVEAVAGGNVADRLRAARNEELDPVVGVERERGGGRVSGEAVTPASVSVWR